MYPFDPLRILRVAQSPTLPTPSHSQGPKECPCQISCGLDQNCGQERDSYILDTNIQINPVDGLMTYIIEVDMIILGRGLSIPGQFLIWILLSFF